MFLSVRGFPLNFPLRLNYCDKKKIDLSQLLIPTSSEGVKTVSTTEPS